MEPIQITHDILKILEKLEEEYNQIYEQIKKDIINDLKSLKRLS
tara:strand:- start:244 stop:375 length:132 start_codon:yes stop_codon:yes gene_type:complete